ncbi:MAG: acetyl-CoA carboxylase biotin carboxylase subunit [Armatimonadetes bacterium]|nr:acetyl-CoA carboxylase biotin carboxylase subunit [Armatimonadota bacterium]
MIKKVLVANRGEIAVRVIRACRELGIQTVALYSQADAESLHVRLADAAVCVGPPPILKSYLDVPNIISAALITQVDAVHPGYGLLAENARFVEICESHHLTFIGPSVQAMERMGDKALARQTAQELGIPIVHGSLVLEDDEAVRKAAQDIGFPLLIKAAAGGGGKGIRTVQSPPDLPKAVALARSEAQASFGDQRIYLEKFLQDARHIEIQILADRNGRVIHLGERDCSIQRRKQKLIEESPSPIVNEALRARMGEAAKRLAKACGYTSAGTVEFLLDRQGNYYFMEMNTRIQVEHCVTEMVTGQDLVKWQIRIANGEPVPLQEKIVIRGHALECRINAEDPVEFSPSTGKITAYLPPGGPGIRVDSHLYSGYSIEPFYDSLLCKIVSWGQERPEAIARMERALAEMERGNPHPFRGIPVHAPAGSRHRGCFST